MKSQEVDRLQQSGRIERNRVGIFPESARPILLSLLMVASFVCTARAETGVTNTYNATTNNVGGNFVVGSGGGFNLTIVTNAGAIFNATGLVGNGAGGNTNAVIVTGSGSIWTNVAMTVGNNASFNQLTIANSGLVINTSGTIGDGANGFNNSVLVTGGSVWSNVGAIVLGFEAGSSGNSLTISGAAKVYSTTGLGQIGRLGINNVVVITDSGSLWTNSDLVLIGNASAGNQLIISNGAQAVFGSASGPSKIGNQSSAIGNTVTVTGTNSVWTNTGGLTVGESGFGNQLVITNGGLVVNTAGRIGENASGSNNTVIVTGNNSVWSNTTSILVGSLGNGNRLVITNGGKVYGAGNSQIGSSSSNTVVVTGTGSVFAIAGQLLVGNAGAWNQLIVTNSGHVDVISLAIGGNGVNTTGSNNTLTVTGQGSQLIAINGSIIGSSAASNTLIISDGGFVRNAQASIGDIVSSSSNSVVVRGSGSVWSNTGSFFVGNQGVGNSLVISNGGAVYSPDSYVGLSTGGSNNSVIVTGPGSLWQVVSLSVGTNATSKGGGSVLVENGGTLETTFQGMIAGLNGSGTISNIGGVYQFSSTALNNMTPNTAGAISISNGVISFRGVTDANVFGNSTGTLLTNMTFTGNNTFRLNSSSNTTANQNYTFNTGLGATNYAGLQMVNGNTLWRSANLTIGSGGSLLASNTVGTVAATVISTGTIRVVNSIMTFASNVTIVGSYRSDPSTNIFNADVTVDQSGTMSGGVGDRFEFNKSFLIHATNNTGFNLASSSVAFIGGGMHTNAITGQDLGSNTFAYAVAFEQQTNFAYGEFHLGSITDQVCFTCGNIPTVPSNGLYIGWLDLLGNTSLVTNLHAASGINLYYNQTDARNAYLSALTYSLTDCNFATGGGLLMPIIPEPSTLAFLVAVGAALLRRRR